MKFKKGDIIVRKCPNFTEYAKVIQWSFGIQQVILLPETTYHLSKVNVELNASFYKDDWEIAPNDIRIKYMVRDDVEDWLK
jgi:hypothetical protein